MDSSDPKNMVPNGDLLTWYDMAKAQFHPEVTTDENGLVVYPRKQFLADTAMQRKNELDEQKRQGQ